MDTELKAKWVAALRSGEYEQGKEALERQGKFCCLGVLCKVAGWPTEMPETAHELFHSDGPYAPIRAALTTSHNWTEFTRMNDILGYTFPQIADYIEAYL